jgi:predicted MFS family arabinose efflux permease
VGAIVGSLLYGGYCQRVPFRKLIHVAIATGVTCTLAYVGLTRHPSLALGISFFVGLTYMTANLIQFDLAARICHVETAGTTFAILMAVSNLSIVLSAALGGIAFDRVAVGNGPVEAFRWLVVVGSGLTACCWFLVPWLRERAR